MLRGQFCEKPRLVTVLVLARRNSSMETGPHHQLKMPMQVKMPFCKWWLEKIQDTVNSCLQLSQYYILSLIQSETCNFSVSLLVQEKIAICRNGIAGHFWVLGKIIDREQIFGKAFDTVWYNILVWGCLQSGLWSDGWKSGLDHLVQRARLMARSSKWSTTWIYSACVQYPHQWLGGWNEVLAYKVCPKLSVVTSQYSQGQGCSPGGPRQAGGLVQQELYEIQQNLVPRKEQSLQRYRLRTACLGSSSLKKKTQKTKTTPQHWTRVGSKVGMGQQNLLGSKSDQQFPQLHEQARNFRPSGVIILFSQLSSYPI